MGHASLYGKTVRLYDAAGHPMPLLGVVVVIDVRTVNDEPVYQYDVLADDGRQYTGLPANRIAIYAGPISDGNPVGTLMAMLTGRAAI